MKDERGKMTMSRILKGRNKKTCKTIYTIKSPAIMTFSVRTNNARVTTKAMGKHLEENNEYREKAKQSKMRSREGGRS